MTPERSTPRVLIVDDDESTVETFVRMLQLEGYDVVTAPSADAALRVIESARPDVILLDVRMPITDGITFLRQLRAQEKERRIPVAVIHRRSFRRGHVLAGAARTRRRVGLQARMDR